MIRIKHTITHIAHTPPKPTQLHKFNRLFDTMRKLNCITLYTIVLLFSLISYSLHACTVFTADNDTLVLVGNSEDWRQSDPYVWYVPSAPHTYGIVYFGFEITSGYWHTFGGMNDQGLFWDILSTPSYPAGYTSDKPVYPGYLPNFVMERCATVEEVLDIFDTYDLSFMGAGREQYMFTDRTGASVIIERDTVIHKSDEYQVVTNFFQSNPSLGGWPCWRHDLTVQLLEDSGEVTVNHFRSILHAVYRLGDFETDYSTIYDLTNGIVYVYFNHDFENVLTINLEDELAHGARMQYLPHLNYVSDTEIHEAIVDPAFDQGILLVNGVSFQTYGQEILDAYENRAFWGDFPISFWDCFDPPTEGYPSSLPEPLGHGFVPAESLSQFSTVIWVGNDYGIDIGSWRLTPVLPYLEVGGNLLLLTRRGQSFMDADADFQRYLGITWAEDIDNTLHNCISASPGLHNMTLIGDQTYNAVFDTVLTSTESTLLFKETASFPVPRGLGVLRKPVAGGSYRSDGGQFIFISGRPYRYDADQLRPNIEHILEDFFQESRADRDKDGVDDFEDNCPNDFNPEQEDADIDGVGDACDNCPNDYNPDQGDADSDGTGDACDSCTDTDGDGYGDPGYEANTCEEDNCPDIYNPDQIEVERGDINCDGEIDVVDVLAVLNHILNTVPLIGAPFDRADCNGDEKIDVLDIVGLVNVILGISPACQGDRLRPVCHPEVVRFCESLRPNLRAQDFAHFMALIKAEAQIPAVYHLSQNYPNPFNPETEIAFCLPAVARVTLTVYNLLGQVVEVLVDSELPEGYHRVRWSTESVASGVYYYHIFAGDFTAMKKMILLK